MQRVEGEKEFLGGIKMKKVLSLVLILILGVSAFAFNKADFRSKLWKFYRVAKKVYKHSTNRDYHLEYEQRLNQLSVYMLNEAKKAHLEVFKYYRDFIKRHKYVRKAFKELTNNVRDAVRFWYLNDRTQTHYKKVLKLLRGL